MHQNVDDSKYYPMKNKLSQNDACIESNFIYEVYRKYYNFSPNLQNFQVYMYISHGLGDRSLTKDYIIVTPPTWSKSFMLQR